MIFLIALSLSMDAFSLALLYGTLNISKKDVWVTSIIVGIFHFIMPLIGLLIGNIINLHSNLLVFIILLIIGIQMFFPKNEKIHKMNLKEKLLFGLAVSIDSFSIGLVLNSITPVIIFGPLLFLLFSFSFTLLGLNIGKIINEKYGEVSTKIGGVILIIIAITYLFK